MKTKHHLFTYPEIRHALVRVLGAPKTDQEYAKLSAKISEIRAMLPVYEIEAEAHKKLHKAESIRMGPIYRKLNAEV